MSASTRRTRQVLGWEAQTDLWTGLQAMVDWARASAS
jgi:nucleoside-diphosphate-sugar epimerase